MHRELVGRACGKGDGRRVQDGGLARPRAETATEKRLGKGCSRNFRHALDVSAVVRAALVRVEELNTRS